jgi:hypothetical protein
MSISTKPQGPVENYLLAALPDEVLARLLPHLKQVSFALGGVVYESSERMDSLYFPTTCIVSLLYTMTDGATAEMGLVGNDGVLGIALFMGGNTVLIGRWRRSRATPSVRRRRFCWKSSGGAVRVNSCCCATRRR